MNIPAKRLESGFEIPILALGTWTMGGGSKKDLRYAKRDADTCSIRMAIELGINRFDTAESYAEGCSEEILGEAIKGFERRKLFITSKVASWNLKYDDVLRSAEESLRRLGLDYLNLYLIHVPNPEVPLTQTVKALDRLKREGLIRDIGVSNFNAERLIETQRLSEYKIVLNQVHYNLIFREPEIKGVLKHCQDNDIFLEAYRPIQQGALSKSGIVMLDRMCKKYSKTQTQIALNWLISQENVVASVKTSSVEHLDDILGAIGWNIKDEDIKLLGRKFPIQLDMSNSIQLD